MFIYFSLCFHAKTYETSWDRLRERGEPDFNRLIHTLFFFIALYALLKTTAARSMGIWENFILQIKKMSPSDSTMC